MPVSAAAAEGCKGGSFCGASGSGCGGGPAFAARDWKAYVLPKKQCNDHDKKNCLYVVEAESDQKGEVAVIAANKQEQPTSRIRAFVPVKLRAHTGETLHGVIWW